MAPNEPVEVELKLLLPAHARAALKRHRALQAPCATAPETRREHTVYFDTPLLSLAGKGLSLRVRRCGAARVQTLKSEDVDALALRFAGRRRAAGSDRVWLHDRRQASRRASTLQPDEDGRAWSRRDDLFSPDRCLRRNQRRRHHVAPMAEACELAMNAVAAQSGLITKRQRLAGTPETAAKLADGAGFWRFRRGSPLPQSARSPPPRPGSALS